jgi:DNA-binding transcriptional ArsR family regulator
VCDLAAVLRLSQSAVSHQLRLLRNIRLVKPRRDGRIVFYSLDDQHIMSIFKQTLQHVEEEQRLPSAFAKATADKARVRKARAR